MAQTTLLSSIDRGETYPKFFSVSASKNEFYVSITTDSWTEQMFYELPCIRFDLYVEVNGILMKYKTVSSYMGTYNPVYTTDAWEFAEKFTDVPENCQIAITPVFDMNALSSHNDLVENGIEQGDIWQDQTDIFDITIKLITE